MSTPTPAPASASGTATPMELDLEQAAKSLKVSLADLSAKATALYAHKDYEGAAEVYAQAAEMQAEMNGEMSPENAEILFLYGRALFRVGQSKSDVLGGKAPEAKKHKPAKPAKKSPKEANGNSAEGKKDEEENGKSAETEAGEAIAEAAKDGAARKDDSITDVKKPLFHFDGDENFEDSDEEEEGDEGEGEDEEDDDDLAVAFEILDLARVLFNKRLEGLLEPENDKGKAASEGNTPVIRHIKERLGDTHDLLAEISLENERYPNAITDSRAALKYKQELYPEESEIIAEAHFKLALALEFASMTHSADDDTEEGDEAAATKNGGSARVVDQAMRDEAAAELEAAIASTKLKLQNKEVELATLHSPEDNEATRLQIAEVKEVIAEMEQRLVEVRKPPIDLNSVLGLPAKGTSASAPLAQDTTDEIKKNANDLTGLVRKKRKIDDRGTDDAATPEVETKKVKEGET